MNKAPASTLHAKGAFFWKSMDFQLSLEKKIKSVAILVNFLERFEVAHKMKFSSSFFENLKIRQNIIFSLCFDGVIVSQKWVQEKLRFYCRELKIYFQRATGMMNTNLISNTSYGAPFWKRRLFYLKIAYFLQKVWDFGRFLKKEKAPFFSGVFRSSIVQKKLIYIYVMASVYVPCVSDTLKRKRRLFKTSFGISKCFIFDRNFDFWK